MRRQGPVLLLWATAGLLLMSSPGKSAIMPRCDMYSLPGCPRNYNPVCGTDGETYPNECTLCSSNRERDRNIEIAYNRAC